MKLHLEPRLSKEERISFLINEYGWIDGAHHKQWILDQVMRIILDCPVIEETSKDSNGNDYVYKSLGKNLDYEQWADEDAE